MNVPPDNTHQKLSMTSDNRHQYFETAMVSGSESEREMMEAEARGRERRVREAAFKRTLRKVGIGVVAVLAIAAVALLIRLVGR